jgi:hypothetical protein
MHTATERERWRSETSRNHEAGRETRSPCYAGFCCSLFLVTGCAQPPPDASGCSDLFAASSVPTRDRRLGSCFPESFRSPRIPVHVQCRLLPLTKPLIDDCVDKQDGIRKRTDILALSRIASSLEKCVHMAFFTRSISISDRGNSRDARQMAAIGSINMPIDIRCTAAIVVQPYQMTS